MIFELKLKSCMMNLLGSAILAFGLYNIHSLSGITEGGVLGLTLLLEHWFAVSPAISGLILNSACYAIGWKSLGHDFIGYSIFAGGGFSLFYAICEMFPPVFPQVADYPLLAAIIGSLFVGVGVGIAVRAGGAPSGDDALAMSLSHITKLDIKWIYLVSDIIVLTLSLSYIPLTTILYSLLTVILSGSIISFIGHIGNLTAQHITVKDLGPRDVLVGTLRNHAQLETCIKHKFYHIPAARLYPEDFPIRYVAIYQSIYKFGADAGVRYFGEVENCTLIPRYKIKEIPKNSDEMYYRFEIKEWQKLDRCISTHEGDFVNIMTTRFLIENSRETPELFLRSGEERELYLKIRARMSGENFDCKIEHNNAKLNFGGGKITVTKHETEVFSCTFEEYIKRPAVTFRRMINKTEE